MIEKENVKKRVGMEMEKAVVVGGMVGGRAAAGACRHAPQQHRRTLGLKACCSKNWHTIESESASGEVSLGWL